MNQTAALKSMKSQNSCATGNIGNKPELLASAYRRSLELAAAHSLKSIAFPSISTGAYGYPIELAAPLAISTVRQFVSEESSLERVVSCCFSATDLAVYERVLAESS